MIVDLTNKVAIVTGAAGGIGAVYAKALAQSGAQVVVADVNGSGAEATAAGLRTAGFAAHACPVDITDPEQAVKMAAFAQAQCGGVDILVNNAAFMKPVGAPLLTYPLELWRATMDVNVSGTLHCIRAVAPLLIARGGDRGTTVLAANAIVPPCTPPWVKTFLNFPVGTGDRAGTIEQGVV